ncbi:hypothetical protein J6TS2_39590 [Heyndrickxia sporothermodurans]|nr:hypothetical protein J6TS2_39590 [Heyndrickxia sporothermodurans]
MNERHILYRHLTTSQANASELAKELYDGQELEDILYFVKKDGTSGLQILAEHLMNNYQVHVYQAAQESKFYLVDNPVLVHQFDDIDYLFPISPKVCLGLVKIATYEDILLVSNSIYILGDNDVERINKKLVQNTDKLIIVSYSFDLDFVKKVVE